MRQDSPSMRSATPTGALQLAAAFCAIVAVFVLL